MNCLNSDVGQMSQKLMDILVASEYRAARDNLTADKLDWLFEYDGFGDFFTFLVETISEENVIPENLLQRYEDLAHSSPQEILPSGDVLEVLNSLSSLSVQNAEMESTGGELPLSGGNTDLIQKEHTLLREQAEVLRRQTHIFQSQLQLQRLEIAQKEDCTKAETQETDKLEEQIGLAAANLENVCSKLLSEVYQLGAFYASEKPDIGTSGVMGSLPFGDIYKMEEDYATKFTAYTRKQLGHKGVIHLTADGAPIEKPAGLSSHSSGPLSSTTITANGMDHIRNEELAACFKALTPAKPTRNSQNKCLSFMRPGRVGVSAMRMRANENRSDSRLSVDEMTVILQEIYADYGLALMEKSKSVVERERLSGSLTFIEEFIASIERGELSSIIPNLESRLTKADRKHIDLKLKYDTALLSGPNSVASSLDRLVSLSVESILDCGLDLELKRKEYVLDKRERVIGFLKTICSRGLVVRLLLENELTSVTDTVRLGESVLTELQNNDKAMLARKTYFGRSQFSLKQMPKYAVDSVNVFITALHNLLVKFPFVDEDSMMCNGGKDTIEVLTLAHVAEHIAHYIEKFSANTKKTVTTEATIQRQAANLMSFISLMRGVLSTDGLSSSPISMLTSLANRVQRETDAFEAQLTQQIRNVEEMKTVMNDPLVREERLFFTKYYSDSENKPFIVNEVISNLQNRLAF